MIETNETGNKQIQALLKGIDEREWTDWEEDFIKSLRNSKYESMSVKQKGIITKLHEKLDA
jgi:hypothetical protein